MLSIVVTPIGNLGDITYRAVLTLKNADVVYCEDTRRSAVLFARYGITAPVRVYEKFGEARAAETIIGELRRGKNVALVSDAGTPLVSDPGGVLVSALIREGLEYTVVGSGCAAISALVLSGMDMSAFCFAGFLPEKNADRRRTMDRFRDLRATLVFYVAPHDLIGTLKYLADELGNRRAALVREISKLHEEVVRFVLPDIPSETEIRGEMVLVVEGAPAPGEALCGLTAEEHVAHYMEQGMSEKDAMKAAARDRGVSKSEIYSALVGSRAGNVDRNGAL